MLDDTIIAISTPIGYGGMGIVRLSGKDSVRIAMKVFKPGRGKEKKITPRVPVFGNIYHFEEKEAFDEGYLTYFPAPHSYTRENVVEIVCHGSPVVLEALVRLGVKAGARHAHPGEFTLRAYLKGRIDLLQAEAVNDLITASSLKQARISFGQLEGKLTRRMELLRRSVIHLLAQIEAGIEFPDERLRLSPKKIEMTLGKVRIDVKKLIDSHDMGKILTDGLTLTITGRANVGKSTLFNALLEKERAIVSPYPGTTRDYLRERIRIRDSFFSLIDMAGLNRPSHPVEKEGIKRSRELALRADGILLLFDTSLGETSEDLRLIQMFKDKKALLVFNKIDLSQRMDVEKVKLAAKGAPAVSISALKGRNLDKLKEKVYEFFSPPERDGEDIILHLREKILLEKILFQLDSGLALLREGHSEEIYAEEIRQIVPLIGQLTGEIRVDDVMEDIFSRFCVGK